MNMRSAAKRIIRPMVAKPWNSPVMETRYGLWNGVSALFSEGGRQLGEENARPFILNHHIPAQTIECKYEGSREGCPINMSALRIAMTNFDEAMAITAAVRAFHAEKIGQKSVDAQLGIWDLYIIARASIALIAYRQRNRPKSGAVMAADAIVPDVLTSQYQFISGVFMICREMMNTGEPIISQNTPISAADLYAYADENGIFLSFNNMACAGSTKKIMEFLEFCNHGPSASKESKFNLGSIIDDPENWYQYALSTIDLDCFLEIEAMQQRASNADKAAEQTRASSAIYRALASYCTTIGGIDCAADDTRSFADAVLARQNAILQLLNKPTVRKIAPKHLQDRLNS